MSIDARVRTVHHNEDGSGRLALDDRPGGCRGQPELHYDAAPYEVTALNGLEVWGGCNDLMLGDIQIAERIGYTRIKFCDDEKFKLAVKKYHKQRRMRIPVTSDQRSS